MQHSYGQFFVQNSQQQPTQSKPRTMSSLLQSIQQFLLYHIISLGGLSVFLIAISIHYYGSQTNKKIAQKYQLLLSPIISQWFKRYDGKLIYESPNIVKMYPSECQSCLFAIISMALVPRQQMISFFFNPFIFGLKDQLVVQVPINNEYPLSITGAIVRKKQIKTITKKSFPDIKQLCKQYRPKQTSESMKGQNIKFNVPDSHSILVEKADNVRYFLYSEKQTNIWMKHGKSVKLVYISDVNKFSRYPLAVRMVINLNEQDIPPMLEWLMSFIERMSKVKMSLGERKQALKKRETLNITYQ